MDLSVKGVRLNICRVGLAGLTVIALLGCSSDPGASVSASTTQSEAEKAMAAIDKDTTMTPQQKEVAKKKYQDDIDRANGKAPTGVTAPNIPKGK